MSPNADKMKKSKSVAKKGVKNEEQPQDIPILQVKDTKEMTIWQKVKYFGAKRYRVGSVKYVRYKELALKYFMGGQKA